MLQSQHPDRRRKPTVDVYKRQVSQEARQEKELVPYEKNIQKFVAMPAMAKKLHVAQEKRLNQIEADSIDFPINKMEIKDKKIGIITSGICYQYVKEALPEASVLKMGLINPLPKEMIRQFAQQVEQVYVIEEIGRAHV